MKIAFVYDAVYPWVKGGAEKRIYELGRHSQNAGMMCIFSGLNGGMALANFSMKA